MVWKHLYAYPETVPRFFLIKARKEFSLHDETLNYLMDLSELKFKIEALLKKHYGVKVTLVEDGKK